MESLYFNTLKEGANATSEIQDYSKNSLWKLRSRGTFSKVDKLLEIILLCCKKKKALRMGHILTKVQYQHVIFQIPEL